MNTMTKPKQVPQQTKTELLRRAARGEMTLTEAVAELDRLEKE